MNHDRMNLACDLYQRYAKTLARKHSKGVTTLPLWMHVSAPIRDYWTGIAAELIRHSGRWLPNKGAAVALAPDETERIRGDSDYPKSRLLTFITMIANSEHDNDCFQADG